MPATALSPIVDDAVDVPAAPSMTAVTGEVVPLVAAAVTAEVCGLDVTWTLTHTFVNTTAAALEVVYNFPLPPTAAATAAVARVAHRKVTALLKRREEARADYETALAEGRFAALTEQDRPSTFTTTVGNLPAGETATVTLTVVGRVDVDLAGDRPGWYRAELRFPTVIGQRYTEGVANGDVPVGHGSADDTDLVPDASRVTPPVTADAREAVRLKWSATIDAAGMDIDAFSGSAPGRVEFSLRGGALSASVAGDPVADCDVVVRWHVRTADLVAAAVRVPDSKVPGDRGARKAVAGSSTVAVTLMPPAAASSQGPRDIVMLVDQSGSMGGWKMPAAADLAGRLVSLLTPADQFAVAAFDDRITPYGPIRAASSAATAGARDWLAQLRSRGGTMMAQALGWAVAEFQSGRATAERILIVVTDGDVSGEDAVLAALGAAGVRVLAVGVGHATNLGLLDRLAATTGGFSAIASCQGDVADVAERMERRLSTPVLVDPQVELVSPAGRVELTGVIAPAVHEGVPTTFYGRVAGRVPPGATVVVSGRGTDGTDVELPPVALRAGTPAVAHQWARSTVNRLTDARARGIAAADTDGVVAVSLGFSVLSQFTAFIAVDDSGERVSGPAQTMVQPHADVMFAASTLSSRSMLRGQTLNSIAGGGSHTFSHSGASPAGGSWSCSTDGGPALAGGSWSCSTDGGPASAGSSLVPLSHAPSVSSPSWAASVTSVRSMSGSGVSGRARTDSGWGAWLVRAVGVVDAAGPSGPDMLAFAGLAAELSVLSGTAAVPAEMAAFVEAFAAYRPGDAAAWKTLVAAAAPLRRGLAA